MTAESRISEWMRVMLEEIAHKRTQQDEMRAEEDRRREEQRSRQEPHCPEEQRSRELPIVRSI
jgi:hypothetical protein